MKNIESNSRIGGRQDADLQLLAKRQPYVDIMKGWAMLTIIVFHCSHNCIQGTVAQILGNPWNVPIFFIIGGFFLTIVR